MEKLVLRSSSSQAKIVGTIVSISGAFAMTLYEGPPIVLTLSPSKSLHWPHSLLQSNWSIGGLLLAAENLLVPVWFIIQANIMKEYPVDLVVVFLYSLCTTVMCAAVALVAEPNSSAWRLKADISLVAIVYSGLFESFISTVIQTWALRLKGPVYVSLFKPLSIAIAAAMGVMFLGDTLNLGSVVGAIIISIGFYGVMWGKAKEEMMEGSGVDSLDQSSTQTTALLQHHISESCRKNTLLNDG